MAFAFQNRGLRRKWRANVPDAGAEATRAERSCMEYDVPADGTGAATGQSGDFGTSPLYGQHLNKLPLAYSPTMGASEAKHKKLVCLTFDGAADGLGTQPARGSRADVLALHLVLAVRGCGDCRQARQKADRRRSLS